MADQPSDPDNRLDELFPNGSGLSPSLRDFRALERRVTALEERVSGNVAPGTPDTAEPDNSDAVVFDIPNFSPTPGDEVAKHELLLPGDQVFSKIAVSMRVTHGGWYPEEPDGLHGLFWLYRGKWKSNTFAYLNLRGPGRNKLTQLTNVGLPEGVTARDTTGLVLREGEIFGVETDWWPTGVISDVTYRDVDTKNSVPPSLYPRGGETFTLELGLRLGPGEEPEVPTHGWWYENVRVVFS